MNSEQIYNYIERLSNLMRNESRKEGASTGLQPIHLETLHYLSLCNKYSDTPMAVTEYLGQTKGTVSQTLKVLEKKGLLTKEADPKDKRMTHLKVSKNGQKLLNQLIPYPLFTQTCSHLSQSEQDNIGNSLKALLNAIQTTNQLKTFGVCQSCKHHQQKDNVSFCGLTQESLTTGDTQRICREHLPPENHDSL